MNTQPFNQTGQMIVFLVLVGITLGIGIILSTTIGITLVDVHLNWLN